MRSTPLGVIIAVAIMLAAHGAAFAAPPDASIAAVRSNFGYVDQPIIDDDSLSNQPINDPND
jgi:hypothetical protein